MSDMMSLWAVWGKYTSLQHLLNYPVLSYFFLGRLEETMLYAIHTQESNSTLHV